MNNWIKSIENFVNEAIVLSDSKIVVFTVAVMSAESGLSTFRDNGVLCEEHKIEEVTSIETWHRDSSKVLEFYNQCRP
jgi:NAD-dependent deacetylase